MILTGSFPTFDKEAVLPDDKPVSLLIRLSSLYPSLPLHRSHTTPCSVSIHNFRDTLDTSTRPQVETHSDANAGW
ncbi:uncharacterized [Tachysurus ichikawai]